MVDRESGRNMENEKRFTPIALETEAAARIEEIALQLPPGIYEDSFEKRGEFLTACKAIARELENSNVGPALHGLKTGLRVVAPIRGLPRDRSLPPAPMDGSVPTDKKTFVSEGVACGIAMSIGYPSLILSEKKKRSSTRSRQFLEKKTLNQTRAK